ncbi:MAG TPA: AI-2E family transporter [Polyangiaceae bacterium]
MRDLTHDPERLRRVVLVVVALGITLLFLGMIAEFLIALLLAALAAGILRPLNKRMIQRFGGRRSLAAAVATALLFFLGIGPVVTFAIIVGVQAVDIAQEVGPWARDHLGQVGTFNSLAERFPELESLRPYRNQILAKLGELGSTLGSLVVAAATAAARETFSFFLLLFVMLYATFFFLLDGRETLQKILYYLPLPPEDEERLVARFVSVARATIKGSGVVGIAQGAAGGIGFWVAGIQGAALWATVMAVFSIVPGIGTAVVWVPAVVYLFATGHTLAAVLLAIWCVVVVGTIDNFLRPWLVGKDTKMSDLLVLLSTLGGITMFGAVGVVIGPIIAALFVTVWEIYGEVFEDVLPEPAPLSIPRPSSPSIVPPRPKGGS